MEYVKPITHTQLCHMRDELRRIQHGLDLWVDDFLTDVVDDLLAEESKQEEEESEKEEEEREQKSESFDEEYVKTSTTSNKRVAVRIPDMTVKEKVRRWLLAARPDAQPSIVVAEGTSTKPFVAVEPPTPAPPVPAPLDIAQTAPDRNCWDFMREFFQNNFQEEPELAVMEPEPIDPLYFYERPFLSPSYSPLPASSPSEVGESLVEISSDEGNWEQDIDVNDLLTL